MTRSISKFYSIIFALLVMLGAFSLSLPGLNSSAQISYAFADEQNGCAGGTVTVTASIPGTYKLYWGDENGNRLTAESGDKEIPYTEFGAVTVSKGEGSADIYEYIAIPEGAETVLAYQGALKKGQTAIPEDKQTVNGELLYSFGALSDVHFNRYNLSLTGDDACLAFRNALDFMDRQDVSLVAISGDISTKAEEDSFRKFREIVSDFDFPVYSCTGNHDVGYDEIWDLWHEYVNPDVYANPDRGDIELAENGIDFVYKGSDLHGDVFIFLSQRYWDYNKETSRLLEDSQLDWLEAKFEQYKDRHVYLYFHIFMADDNNDPGRGEGNLVNNKGVTYDLTYTVGTPDEVRMKALLKEYKNVIFFNGHSHWDFDSYTMNEQTNITSYGGQYATFVHIPSVSSPRSVEPDSTDRSERYMRSSQGYIVNVYADKIVLTGVEFWGTRYLSYATFNIYN